MSSVITKSSKKKDKRQINEKKLQFRKGLYKKQKRRLGSQGIHQVLYIVQLSNEEGYVHII